MTVATVSVFLLLLLLGLLLARIVWSLVLPALFWTLSRLREAALIRTCPQLPRSEIEARMIAVLELLLVEGSLTAPLSPETIAGLRLRLVPAPRVLPVPIWPTLMLQVVDAATGADLTLVPTPILVPATAGRLERLRLHLAACVAAMKPTDPSERMLRSAVLKGSRPGNLILASRMAAEEPIVVTLRLDEISAHRRIAARQKLRATRR